MTLSLRNIGKTVLQKVYTPHRFLWQLVLEQPAVALTFDDGPDPVYTPAMLDLLAVHGIKATFFVIGEKVKANSALMRRMADEGHAIGGHTWSHLEIIKLSQVELASQLARCRDAIREASGVDTVLFRPPRGRVNLSSIHRVCRMGYCLVHWGKTYSDYQRDGVGHLIARFRKDKPVPRDIILLHDHNADTVAALAILIPEWKADGLVFSTLSAG